MTDGILLSKRSAKRVIVALATIGAVSLTVEGTIGERPEQIDLRGAIPQNLGPDQYVVGVPWTGEPAKIVRVADLEAASAREPKYAGPKMERRREQAGDELRNAKRENPDAPRVASWPLREPGADAHDGGPSVAFTVSTAFTAETSAESPWTPPDTNGAVGPSQILVPANGRIKIFTKAGALVTSFTDNSLFAAITSQGVSDPHVRYDRTSGRWFITEIDVANTSNKILVAVSSGSSITSSSNFSVYGFNHDTPAGGGIDAGHFADYDTLGVDANALYLGINEFTSSVGSFQNTSAYVINKANLIAGTLTVTPFRGLAVGLGAGAWTPQGVQNDDPSATEGYFIGVDNSAFSTLDIYRVSTPGGTPTLSGALVLTVPTTAFPQAQPASGSALPLDSLDDRLFAAEIRTNRYTGVQTLWTAHNIKVTNAGAGSSLGDRNGSRWYQIGTLATTPTLVQSGTVFDNSASNPLGYWIPSVVANGEGHAAIAASYAGTTAQVGIIAAGRLSGDSAGTMANPGVGTLVVGGSNFNLQTSPGCSCSRQRWGDYSQTVVDPTDDMTMWTFQEFASSTDTYAVRATKLVAPPPATPVSASPLTVPKSASTNITITGSSSGGSGFFDPGAGFANRITVSFSGGVIANTVTVVDATHLQVNINSNAASGPINVSVTNPDGQNIGVASMFSVSGGLISGDFDGDAKSDMTIYQSDGTWRILRSTSGYTAATTVGWGGAGYVPVPGDYDGDGKIDPAVYNTTTGQWIALKSSTSYTTSFSQSWGGSGYLPEPGDYDGDGKTDLGLYVSATGQWSILKSSTGYSTTISVGWGGTGYTPVPGKDFDGDGKSDVIIYSESAGTWYILKSSTSFSTTMNLAWGGAGYTLVAGDYDGDGKADAGLYERATGNWLVLLSASGYTTTLNKSWGGPGYDPVPGDYDGDGKYDLGIVQRSTGNWSILRSSSSYTTTISVTGWGASSDALVSGAIVPGGGGNDTKRSTDVDGDGKADLTVYTAAGQWLSLLSSASYTTTLNKSWGGSGYVPAPGDFDGDGKVDLSIYQPSTGTWFVLLSSSGYTTSLSRSAGGTNYIPVVGDYDGDGKSDFAVYNTVTGNWFALKSSTGYTTTVSVGWGGTGYTATPGDFDGDGKTDLGLYQGSTGNWLVLLSSSGYTTTLNKSAGGAGYIPVQADYDGDGKADFVAYNSTSGLWYGLKSSTGYTTTVSVSWGGPGYTPVRGDFDGDGKTDLAIYQASSGNWYVLLSGAGYTTTLNKSWGGAGYTPTATYP